MIVFLDPGHNGSNDGSISRQVPTGRGGTKNCQESGTSTNDGYPEHSFTWETTLRIRQELTALGVRTAMSRGNDTGLGPCVDERAAMANALKPNAIVSIHADGGPPTGRGFHVLYSSPPLNQVQAGPSVQFAQTMRDQLQASGLVPSTYVGTGGLNPRSDIAGLNLEVQVTAPTVRGIAMTTAPGFEVGDDVGEFAELMGEPYDVDGYVEVPVETGPELGPPEVEGRANAYSVVIWKDGADGFRLVAPVNIGVARV